jgi:hypothetical protein
MTRRRETWVALERDVTLDTTASSTAIAPPWPMKGVDAWTESPISGTRLRCQGGRQHHFLHRGGEHFRSVGDLVEKRPHRSLEFREALAHQPGPLRLGIPDVRRFTHGAEDVEQLVADGHDAQALANTHVHVLRRQALGPGVHFVPFRPVETTPGQALPVRLFDMIPFQP